MRYLFLLLLLSYTHISSEDYSVELNGTVGAVRFVMLSENTVSCEAAFTQSTDGAEFLLGTVQLNLFDNTSSGGGDVYMDNFEYIEDMWRAILPANGGVPQGGTKNEQVRLTIYDLADTSGAPISDAANPYLVYTTTNNITENVTVELAFYATNDTENSTENGTFYGNFQFTWTD